MSFNNNLISFTEADLIYSIGLSVALRNNPKITAEDVKYMSQDDVDKLVFDGLESIKSGIFPVEVELLCGSEAYSGYDPRDVKNRILCQLDDGSTEEIVSNICRVDKNENPEMFSFLEPIIKVLVNPREIRIKATISPEFSFESTPASVLNMLVPQGQEAAA